jgi:hypothetical protein
MTDVWFNRTEELEQSTDYSNKSLAHREWNRGETNKKEANELQIVTARLEGGSPALN